jgi:hypothetical protein
MNLRTCRRRLCHAPDGPCCGRAAFIVLVMHGDPLPPEAQRLAPPRIEHHHDYWSTRVLVREPSA